MNDEILKAIHEELVAIRKLLAESQAAKPAASSASSRSAAPSRSAAATSSSASSFASSRSSASGGSRGDDEIPQPTEVVANPGDVQIHFGKNNGVPLSQLNERSLSWYAQEQAPRLDSSGKPYPPRPQDVSLRNAARTLWHQNKGTLGKAGAAKSTTAEELPIDSSAHVSDEEVPF